jgi:hypothetical protein
MVARSAPTSTLIVGARKKKRKIISVVHPVEFPDHPSGHLHTPG